MSSAKRLRNAAGLPTSTREMLAGESFVFQDNVPPQLSGRNSLLEIKISLGLST